MLSCIVSRRGVLHDRDLEIRSTKVGVRFKNQIHSHKYQEALHEQVLRRILEYSVNGPGVADRNRQCGSGSVLEEDGVWLFATID